MDEASGFMRKLKTLVSGRAHLTQEGSTRVHFAHDKMIVGASSILVANCYTASKREEEDNVSQRVNDKRLWQSVLCVCVLDSVRRRPPFLLFILFSPQK